eukprot:TRINITY_DN24274_c0_g1_i1.p1 TRINITY_DN24274_c0_g1~~TRINITY_DN24274_c0_g1_i1.p1  ORF type:complete len:513 (+),score=120.97 TRINITY_DN24274_c0_g1_i1:111-1649(+)
MAAAADQQTEHLAPVLPSAPVDDTKSESSEPSNFSLREPVSEPRSQTKGSKDSSNKDFPNRPAEGGNRKRGSMMSMFGGEGGGGKRGSVIGAAVGGARASISNVRASITGAASNMVDRDSILGVLHAASVVREQQNQSWTVKKVLGKIVLFAFPFMRTARMVGFKWAKSQVEEPFSTLSPAFMAGVIGTLTISLALLVMYGRHEFGLLFDRQYFIIVAIGTFGGWAVALQNLALEHISASLVTTLMQLTNINMIVMQRVFFKKWPSTTQILCLLGICCSCAAYSFSSSSGGDGEAVHIPSVIFMNLSAMSLALFGTFFELKSKKFCLAADEPTAELMRCMIYVEIGRASLSFAMMMVLDGENIIARGPLYGWKPFHSVLIGAAITTAIGTSGQQFCSNAFGVLTMRVAASLENTSTYIMEVLLLQVIPFRLADLFILMGLTVSGAAYAISAIEVRKAAMKAEQDIVKKVSEQVRMSAANRRSMMSKKVAPSGEPAAPGTAPPLLGRKSPGQK